MKLTVYHTGEVCVSPFLPYGDGCSLLKASGLTTRPKDRMWLPVSCYLIEHPKGTILFDTGWDRSMSPKGKKNVLAQIRSLGSLPLYLINQGFVPSGETAAEQLAAAGIKAEDIDFVLLSHLDCDHANGLPAFKGAKRKLVAADELEFAKKPGTNQIRFYKGWWKNTGLETFDWNGTDGPFRRSYDLFGDGSVVMINIPGHTDGLCALKLTGEDGRFVLLYSDGGYATKSWKEQILPGISSDHIAQKKSLEWIRDESLDEKCILSLANHDPDVKPMQIEF